MIMHRDSHPQSKDGKQPDGKFNKMAAQLKQLLKQLKKKDQAV